jgi:hypothetical protein
METEYKSKIKNILTTSNTIENELNATVNQINCPKLRNVFFKVLCQEVRMILNARLTKVVVG